jgi:hypothetical protein
MESCKHDGPKHAQIETADGVFEICDECRRLVCVCRLCTAFGKDSKGKTVCMADPPPHPEVMPTGLCRDKWQQGKLLPKETAEELFS